MVLFISYNIKTNILTSTDWRGSTKHAVSFGRQRLLTTTSDLWTLSWVGMLSMLISLHCWHWVVFPPEKPISRHVLWFLKGFSHGNTKGKAIYVESGWNTAAGECEGVLRGHASIHLYLIIISYLQQQDHQTTPRNGDSVTTSTDSVFTDVISNSCWTNFKFVHYSDYKNALVKPKYCFKSSQCSRVSRMSLYSNKD